MHYFFSSICISAWNCLELSSIVSIMPVVSSPTVCFTLSLQYTNYNSSLFWTFLCISDFVCCNAVNLYKAAIISFYGKWNGSNSVQFHVMSEYKCHYCGAFTEQR